MTDTMALEVLAREQEIAYRDRDYELMYALETAMKAIKEKNRLEQYVAALKEGR